MTKRKAVKRATKKGLKKGDVYQCSVCGLAVTVDEVCRCVDACGIIGYVNPIVYEVFC